MLRTIRATVSTQRPIDQELWSPDYNEMSLKLFFTEARTDALKSSTIDNEEREEAFRPSDLQSGWACLYERVREILQGLLPPDSPCNAFFTNLLISIACACAGAPSMEARFDVDNFTPARPDVCMLCLTEYTFEDVLVHHRRCGHHFHRRCSENYDENYADCAVCSHHVKVIERIHVSVDGQVLEAEISKCSRG